MFIVLWKIFFDSTRCPQPSGSCLYLSIRRQCSSSSSFLQKLLTLLLLTSFLPCQVLLLHVCSFIPLRHWQVIFLNITSSSMSPYSSTPTPSKLFSSPRFLHPWSKFSSSTAPVFFLDGVSYLPRRRKFSSSTGRFLRFRKSKDSPQRTFIRNTKSSSFFGYFLPRRRKFSSSTVHVIFLNG